METVNLVCIVMQEVRFVRFYKLDAVWLCKLTQIVRAEKEGIMLYWEYEPTYILVWNEKNIWASKSMEVPVYINVTSGEEYYNGISKGVFNVSDIGKTFVTERNRIPEDFFSEEELLAKEISEERLLLLYRQLFYSNLIQ